jgi:hypothetical protein
VDTYELDPAKIRDIAADVLDDQGRLRVLPASYWASTTPAERGLLGHRYGLYSFPTTELVEHLRGIINGRSAIEIGAGHGVLAEALDIPATDSREQERPEYQALLALQGQPTVSYGPNVIECHASRAVRRFKPPVVIGCWVTQNWDPKRPDQVDSKIDGIDEEDIIRRCEMYVVVGNEHIHRNKRIWQRRHQIEYPPFVYSRAMNGSRDFIATWPGSGGRKR